MENYNHTIREIYDLQRFAIKLGLENIKNLCAHLDEPHLAYPVIHIAGTNGKGSTAFFLARFLESSGFKTGLFTSPHLADYRERITVNNKHIPAEEIMRFWKKMRSVILERQATFFDTTTAMAFNFFRDKAVDVAVIETGLGGRLDSTNIVQPEMAVITPIHFDHMKQLGNTLSEIAGEKAGIIKPEAHVFSAVQQQEALKVLQSHIRKNQDFYYLPDWIEFRPKSMSLEGMTFDLYDKKRDETFPALRTRQLGYFQIENIALAYLVYREYLDQQGTAFSRPSFYHTLETFIWPGRLQVIKKSPPIIFDVSHNLQGLQTTMESLRLLSDDGTIHLLIGLVNDKGYKQIAQYLSDKVTSVVVTEPETHRRLNADILAEAFNRYKQNVRIIPNSLDAFRFASAQIKAGDLLLVTGSHYLIGELLKHKII